MNNLHFYTLLYIDSQNRSLSINGISGTFERQMRTFVRCCEMLSRSMQHFASQTLTVLTNDAAYIQRLSAELNCLEIDFSLEIPTGIRFFAAHHKLDVFRHLAHRPEDEYSVLMDSDVICLHPLTENFLRCVSRGIPTYYDLTSTGANNQKRIRDKNLFMDGTQSYGLWSGGEFLGGDCHFFSTLCREVDEILPIYLQRYKELSHQGDEMLVSVALEKMMQRQFVCNAETLNIIERFWSESPGYPQKAWKEYTFVHLPSDKHFMDTCRKVDNRLARRYRRYLCWRRCKQAVRIVLQKLHLWHP